MPNIRLVLEYDGRRFHGWQKQPGLRTIQGELERVLSLILRTPLEHLYAAGRTDAGVHARGQVVNFIVNKPAAELPALSRIKRSVSHILRGEVSVLSVDFAADDFNARASALSKQYSYLILHRDTPAVLDRRRAWSVFSKLDLAKMEDEARLLTGVHDFSSFRGPDCEAPSPLREILESELTWQEPYLRYRVVGRGFLKQMVRIMVGTLVGLGKGKLAFDTVREILQAKDRRAAGVTAPPYGLYLDWVRY